MNIEKTLSERNETHGDYKIQSCISQSMYEMLIKHSDCKLDSQQKQALYMICLKMSRIATGNPNEMDHWHDIAGYATLVENILRNPSPTSGGCVGLDGGNKSYTIQLEDPKFAK